MKEDGKWCGETSRVVAADKPMPQHNNQPLVLGLEKIHPCSEPFSTTCMCLLVCWRFAWADVPYLFLHVQCLRHDRTVAFVIYIPNTDLYAYIHRIRVWSKSNLTNIEYDWLPLLAEIEKEKTKEAVRERGSPISRLRADRHSASQLYSPFLNAQQQTG
jgi:hypothetical protein